MVELARYWFGCSSCPHIFTVSPDFLASGPIFTDNLCYFLVWIVHNFSFWSNGFNWLLSKSCFSNHGLFQDISFLSSSWMSLLLYCLGVVLNNWLINSLKYAYLLTFQGSVEDSVGIHCMKDGNTICHHEFYSHRKDRTWSNPLLLVCYPSSRKGATELTLTCSTGVREVLLGEQDREK